MVPGKHNITIFRGSTFSIGITAKNDNGTAMMFSDYISAQLEIRKPWAYALGTRPDPIKTLSTVNGDMTITDTGEGLTIHLTAAVTEALDFDKGVYVIELLKMDGEEAVVDKLLYGYLIVKGEDIV